MRHRTPRERLDGIPVFDCHLHGPAADGKVFQWAPMLRDYADYLAFLRAAGVRGGIQTSITAVMAKTERELAAGNRAALALARAAGRGWRLLPACIVHPSFPAQARRDLAVFRRAGSRWVGELCPYLAGWTPAHPRFRALLRLLETAGAVLQIHAQTDEVHRMIAACAPGLPLVISHLGGRAEIEQKLDLARACPTVYLDICGRGYERLGVLELAVARGLEDRILYGSDYPVNDPGAVLARILGGRFSPAVRRKILGGNLARLLAARGMRLPPG